ncbi:uncharacterized protein LOC134262956 [Saccostrea cucullata]|uniref:uncharacterized protein LOC134262956 n=1 Tax=Saccostrea cuccullata TaxID=36930 RepID=UPI002ECFB4D3
MENTIKEWLRYAKDRDEGGRNGHRSRRKEGGGGDSGRGNGALGEGSDGKWQRKKPTYERRAGQKIEEVAKQSMDRAAKETYKLEMRDAAHEEMTAATVEMGEVIDDLGVGLMPDASPSLRSRIATFPHEPDSPNTDNQDQSADSDMNRERVIPYSNFRPLLHLLLAHH